MSSLSASLRPYQFFLHRVAESSSNISSRNTSPEIIHVHHHYRREPSFFSCFSPSYYFSMGPIDAGAERERAKAERMMLSIIIGAATIIGGALVGGSALRSFFQKSSHYTESRDVTNRVSNQILYAFNQDLDHVYSLAHRQLSIDRTEFTVQLMYLISIVTIVASGSFLLAGGLLALEAAQVIGAIGLVAGLSLSAFIWSFDDPSYRQKEQNLLSQLAREILRRA